MADDIEDEDFLLSQLTAEEIAELSEIIDPDNELLPASDRLPPQTKKKPTGPYDRQHLLEHLRKEALASKVGDDYTPFIKQKREEVREKKKENTAPAAKPKNYLSEFDDILSEMDDDQLAELAQELGIHGMLTQDQSRGDITASKVSSFSTQKLNKLLSAKGNDESDHADLDQVIQSVQEDDPSLTDLNLNNHPLITPEIIHQLLTALEGNTHVTKLSLANIKFNDDHAASLGSILSDNRSLLMINLDSNRLGNEGIRAIMKALVDNFTLQEIRLCNQYSKGGHRIEAEIGKYLEKNKTIRKLGYSFTCNGPRMEVEKWIMRNIDLQRQRRMYDSR
ncbi:PREDICTED: tropomodulin-2-like [Amphimedon queenslandica]|uniref:Tropomodulin n=1 Tax=Amphimedon queenslandica TaxID=400682 RepID=A0A1X7TLP7_AMPQE|nr:PREDICTED: tropomodulin-2-like [Amphimedon queenslandica]|eukprot:XP_019858876.1 PREDICTED: tropomodulin-2-like [Amphimedon queenslandica]